MTTLTPFWRDPVFLGFLPYVKATAAGDKRHFNHPRFDLLASTPAAIRRAALAYEGPCCRCHRPIQPFRLRRDGSSVYLAVACENSVRMGCSRGNDASEAYDEIWRVWKGLLPDPIQRPLI